MTVKELKEALNKVKNDDIEVIIYNEMLGGNEIEYVVHQKDEPEFNFKERVELMVGCEVE